MTETQDRFVFTEAEAKTKLCFKAATFGASQQLADGPGPNCIASQCMAWRLCETPEFNRKANAEFQKSGRRNYSDTGYCGLAGNPYGE